MNKNNWLSLSLLMLSLVVFAQNKVVLKEETCCNNKSQCSMKSTLTEVCQKACGVDDYDPKAVVSLKNAKIGDITTCPISGAVFLVTNLSPSIKVDDEEYYTCCSSCASLAKQRPEMIRIGD